MQLCSICRLEKSYRMWNHVFLLKCNQMLMYSHFCYNYFIKQTSKSANNLRISLLRQQLQNRTKTKTNFGISMTDWTVAMCLRSDRVRLQYWHWYVHVWDITAVIWNANFSSKWNIWNSAYTFRASTQVHFVLLFISGFMTNISVETHPIFSNRQTNEERKLNV